MQFNFFRITLVTWKLTHKKFRSLQTGQSSVRHSDYSSLLCWYTSSYQPQRLKTPFWRSGHSSSLYNTQCTETKIKIWQLRKSPLLLKIIFIVILTYRQDLSYITKRLNGCFFLSFQCTSLVFLCESLLGIILNNLYVLFLLECFVWFSYTLKYSVIQVEKKKN